MVTRILFDPRRDLTDGSTTSSPVIVEATPTGVREDGSVFLLPTTLTFVIRTGADQINLNPPAASWAWRLVAKEDGVVRQERVARFPDVASIAWQALTDIDPASLTIGPGTARQWDATFGGILELIDQVPGRTGIALDADGVPYYRASGTTPVALDADGVPYIAI